MFHENVFCGHVGLQPKVKAAATVLLSALCLSTAAHAQKTQIITFDAPGADTKPGDNNGTYASGINAEGAITGTLQDSGSAYHGFLRSPNGKITTFDVPAAFIGPYSGTSPSSINDLGEITGYYADANGVDHGFLRSPDGKFKTFDPPGVGGYGVVPIAINLEGAVVGYYTDANFTFHSFVRNPDGTFAAFLAPGQCTGNYAVGCYGSELSNINDFGLSVGNYMDNSPNLVQHGLIRHVEGSFTSYESPKAGAGAGQGTGCPGCFAGLNQFGVIAGIYTDANNVYHGYMRAPDGKFTSFDAPGAGTAQYTGTGCASDCPVYINNWGSLSGVYIDANNVYNTYLRYPNGKTVTVDPKGSIFTFPAGINDSEAVAGYYADANGVYHGFVVLSCN